MGKIQSREGRLDDNLKVSTRTREFLSWPFQPVSIREDDKKVQEDAWGIQSEKWSTLFKCGE